MRNNYDVIIIGAGIGGLTSGAYLAKAGAKVLIVERAEKIGGYCGSFEKDGFIFDEAVHYINNMGPNGFLKNVCHELGIDESLGIMTIDPSDRLCMPGLEIAIYHDVARTISGISEVFPLEAKSISAFFKLITNFDFNALYLEYHQRTFQELLDHFFRDDRLKTALGLFATTMGLPANKLSALAGMAYYKGSVLDGGYHPVGGAQAFSNALYKRFDEFGGELWLSKPVSRILVTSGNVEGIELEEGSKVFSRVVISNCDATQTIEKLVGAKYFNHEFISTIKALKPSTSTLVVYLGIKTILRGSAPDCCNLWYFPFDDARSGSLNIVEDDRQQGFVHIGLSSLHDRTMAPEGCESLVLFSGASYKTNKYWQEHKNRLADVLVGRASQIIPDIRDNVRVKLPASPHTLFRYTSNREGAYRGWEPTLNQTRWGLIPQKTSIEGLYLAGHWITTPIGNGGVSMVAQSGRNVSRAVLRSMRHNKINSGIN